MKDVRSILPLAIEFLKKHQVVGARLVAETLLSHFLGLKRIELYMHFDRPIEEEELVDFRAALKRALTGEPLAYILGEIEFFHTKLQLTPAVLIPRQETEILLDKVCQQLDPSTKRVLDLCTGSGCLAIGLKKAHPQLEVVAIDISAKALEVARKNGEANGVEIDWREGDLIKPIREGETFDLVLCNPPYIKEEDYLSLEVGVRDFEPKKALISGPSGYEFFEKLEKSLPQILNPGAKLFFEIGTGQGEGVKKRFASQPWEDLHVEADWAGHDRFFSLRNS